MKKSRNLLALTLCVLMCLSLLAGCGGAGEKPVNQSATPGGVPANTPDLAAPPPTEDDVRFAEHIEYQLGNAAIAVINPFSPAGSFPLPGSWSARMIYDRLIERDFHTGEILPALATEWGTEDYQTFTFKLRDDVYFHNGDKFTAQDVKNTIELGWDGIGSRANDVWMNVKSANIIDDYTIELILTEVNVDFYFYLYQPIAGIVNKKAIDANPETGTWVGTGPYVIADFLASDYITFERNDSYWGELPITKSQTWRFVPEVSTRTIMLENGESHIGSDISEQEVPIFVDNPGFNVLARTLNSPFGLFFNQHDPIAGDLNFRLAVACAIDREEIAVFAAGEWSGALTVNPYWGIHTEFRDESIEALPLDLEKAKEYLDASSYDGSVIEIVAQGPARVRGAQVVQQQLAKIGVNVSVNEMDAASIAAYTSWTDNKSQMFFGTASIGALATSARDSYYPAGSSNGAAYNNPRVVELFDLAPTITDVKEREAVYYEIQKILAEEMPFIGIFYRLTSVVTVAGVGGVNIDFNSMMDDYRYAYMVLED